MLPESHGLQDAAFLIDLGRSLVTESLLDK